MDLLSARDFTFLLPVAVLLVATISVLRGAFRR
jgi:hypothetical protein